MNYESREPYIEPRQQAKVMTEWFNLPKEHPKGLCGVCEKRKRSYDGMCTFCLNWKGLIIL